MYTHIYEYIHIWKHAYMQIPNIHTYWDNSRETQENIFDQSYIFTNVRPRPEVLFTPIRVVTHMPSAGFSLNSGANQNPKKQ